MQLTTKHLPGLDPLRGLLALLVAYAHAFGHITGWDMKASFVESPGFAVDVFFLLSGIVLLWAYEDRYGGSWLGAFKFVALRFFRLWPLYAFSTAFILLFFYFYLDGNIPAWVTPDVQRDLPLNLMMLNSVGFVEPLSINHPAWSISVEFWIGCAFVLGCLWRKWPGLLAGLAISVTAILFAGVKVRLGWTPTWLGFSHGAFRCLAAMAIGATIFEALRKVRIPRHAANAGAILTLIIILANVLGTQVTNGLAYLTTLAVLAAGMACITRSDLGRGLEIVPFTTLGRLSYSIYLMHVPVIYVLVYLTTDRSVGLVHLSIAITIAVSFLTYRWIEAPGIALGKRILSQRRAATAVPSAA